MPRRPVVPTQHALPPKVARAPKRGLERIGHGDDSPLPALGNVDHALPDGLLDRDLPAPEVYVAPPQGENLAHTKPGIAPEEDHGEAAHVVAVGRFDEALVA